MCLWSSLSPLQDTLESLCPHLPALVQPQAAAPDQGPLCGAALGLPVRYRRALSLHGTQAPLPRHCHCTGGISRT